MIEASEVETIKKTVSELLEKMTVPVFDTALEVLTGGGQEANDKDAVHIHIQIDEPQVLIGHNGQTLSELERLLRIILNKKLKKEFYVALDINEYKAKKVRYLKDLAVTLADQAIATHEEKVLSPMPNYERRIIHAQLAERTDVVTESRGEGPDRCVVIKPK
ncbi:hypothetical protein KW786_01110 [Candidatus Parcubacteria bacterium]|nr:hypothetical protein [Candidatus Parcubacteria bacterium]